MERESKVHSADDISAFTSCLTVLEGTQPLWLSRLYPPRPQCLCTKPSVEKWEEDTGWEPVTFS